MGQSEVWDTNRMKTVLAVLIIGLLVFSGGLPVSSAEDGAPNQQPGVSSSLENGPSAPEPAEQLGGEIQERGLTKGNLKKIPRGTKVKPPPNLPGGNLPANLCHQETHMMTQCRCFNNADCQVLSNLCPGSCPIGSQTCQCTPLFRGTPPPLPQNLCGYQVPFTMTKCSCSNDADCQVLSSICPGSCPVGSQSCQCTPDDRAKCQKACDQLIDIGDTIKRCKDLCTDDYLICLPLRSGQPGGKLKDVRPSTLPGMKAPITRRGIEGEQQGEPAQGQTEETNQASESK